MSSTTTVEGMSCGHYEQTVENALHDIGDLSDARADREAETATVEGDPDTTELVEAIEDAGYTARA